MEGTRSARNHRPEAQEKGLGRLRRWLAEQARAQLRLVAETLDVFRSRGQEFRITLILPLFGSARPIPGTASRESAPKNLGWAQGMHPG